MPLRVGGLLGKQHRTHHTHHTPAIRKAVDVLKHPKRKGSRAEHKAIALLEATGYRCTKAGGSLGLFDVIAIGPHDVRCVQVKAGTKYLSGIEREQLQLLTVPANVTREVWRFPDRCREPLIETIR
jgi:hypothetical protein